MSKTPELTDDMISAACAATILGEDEEGKPVHLEPREARAALTAALQSAAEAPASQPDLPTLTSSGSLDGEPMAASVGAESADAHHSKMLDYSKSASNYNPGGNLIGGESPAAETPAPQPRAMGTNLEEVAASIGFVLDNKRWEDCSEGFKETCRKCAAVADRLIREDRL